MLMNLVKLVFNFLFGVFPFFGICSSEGPFFVRLVVVDLGTIILKMYIYIYTEFNTYFSDSTPQLCFISFQQLVGWLNPPEFRSPKNRSRW